MRKRLIFIAGIAICAIVTFTVLHSVFKQENIQPIAALAADTNPEISTADKASLRMETPTSIPYKEVSSYLKTKSGKELLFLSSSDSQDTEFITTSVIAPLMSAFEEPLNMAITHVDMSDTSDVTVVNLQKAFKIESFPSFVLVDTNDKEYKVISTLTFQSDDPFNSDDLKTWFFNNGIWSGPYGKN